MLDDTTKDFAAHWPADRSLELIEETAASSLAVRATADPDHLALVGWDQAGRERRLTYEDLDRAATSVAVHLLEIARPGDHVAVLAPNLVEWPIVEYGASRAGMVLVALNPSAGAEELRYTLDNSGAVLLLHARAHGQRDLDGLVKQIVPDCPAVQKVLNIDVVITWTTTIREPEPATQLPACAPSTAGMIQYTSGTTGKQKGVLLAHRSMVNVARSLMIALGCRPGAVILSPIPMFHTAGCITSTLGPLSLSAPDSV
jgi:acyl-CoA synthetase (AMP-forming)/AMP-acid ligase II